MSRQIELALEDARALRAEGRIDDAERSYADAAALARADGDSPALAHALRHLSDLARERAASGEAWDHASEAAALYRASSDPLGLANAIRLQALSAASEDQAQACWEEARAIYAELGVGAGVAECDLRLAG